MNPIRASTRGITRRNVALAQRTGHLSRRTYAAEPPPPHPPSSPPNPNTTLKERSRVGAYYGTFGSPFLKCFLGALFTYQLTYYAWYKLETIEETHDQATQIHDLQRELREAVEKQRQVAHEKWGQATGAIERETSELGEAVDAVVEEVREGADEVGRATGTVGRVARGGWWPW